MNYKQAAGLGAATGAAGSMAGNLFGFLDKPREFAWSMIPGLHDGETGENYTGRQVMENMLGAPTEESSPLYSPLLSALGIGAETLLDPLTLAGPAAGAIGLRGARAGHNVRTMNRAGELGIQEADRLGGMIGAAERAVADTPDFSKFTVGNKTYPSAETAAALVSQRPGALRKYGGMGGLGSEIGSPVPQFLGDQLERQGYGVRLPNGKMLLAGDPGTRSAFAPRGGRLQQIAEVAPDARGPLYPMLNPQPLPPSLSQFADPADLEALGRSPMFGEAIGRAGLGGGDLGGIDAARFLGPAIEARGEAVSATNALREALGSMPLESRMSRWLTRNPLGV